MSAVCQVAGRASIRQPGMLAEDDNRCTLHDAHNDDAGERRVMCRIMVESERPV